MVTTLFIQTEQVEAAKSILSMAEELTVAGLLLLIVVGLGLFIRSLKKEHKEVISDLKDDLEKLQDKLDKEFEKGNEDVKKIAQNYHVFTTKMIESMKGSMALMMQKLDNLGKSKDV